MRIIRNIIMSITNRQFKKKQIVSNNMINKLVIFIKKC